LLGAWQKCTSAIEVTELAYDSLTATQTAPVPRRIMVVLIANGLLRVANSAGGALVGFYLAHLAAQGKAVDAALVGMLGAVTSGAELTGALPLGMFTDRFSPRKLLVLGALLGAVATQLFGITGIVAIFFLSRAIEGLAAAASGPPLLAHLADITHRTPAVRGRVMGFFELSLLAGLALGGLVGGTLWDTVHTLAFSLLALVYLVVAILFYWGAQTPALAVEFTHPLAGLRRALTDPLLRRLAPAWLAMNAIVGLWLTHIGFQLSGPKVAGQFLVGRFSASQVGWILLGYACVFAVGVTAWGLAPAYVPRVRALRIALVAMFSVCLWLYLLNAAEAWTVQAQLTVLALAALSVMVESGFTPAALTYLADVAEQGEGRGAAMGIYTLLLGLGNVLGAGFGGILARGLAFNGLIVGTVGLAVVAMVALMLLPNKAVSAQVG
jgi:MFS family permease